MFLNILMTNIKAKNDMMPDNMRLAKCPITKTQGHILLLSKSSLMYRTMYESIMGIYSPRKLSLRCAYKSWWIEEAEDSL